MLEEPTMHLYAESVGEYSICRFHPEQYSSMIQFNTFLTMLEDAEYSTVNQSLALFAVSIHNHPIHALLQDVGCFDDQWTKKNME
jgi:hypothetical protein